MATSYEQYKKNTNTWTAWIFTLCDGNGSPTKRNDALTLATPDMSPAYAVSTEEIFRQARFLADSFNQTGFKWPMPKHVRRAYEDARKSRVAIAERRATFGQADDGHAYFISLMERVDALLKDCVEIQTLARATSLAKEDGSTPETVLRGTEEDTASEDEDDDIFEHDPATTDPGGEPSTTYGVDLPLGHLEIMRQNLMSQDFHTNCRSIEDMYVPLRKRILALWDRAKAQGSDFKPEVAAFLTEAAIVWMRNKEQELFEIREAFMEETGEGLSPMPSLALDSPSYVHSVTLKDVSQYRRRAQIAYPITLDPLNVRHKKEMDEVERRNGKNQARSMVGADLFLVHLLGEIGLEIESRELQLRQRKPILSASLDELSPILHHATSKSTKDVDIETMTLTSILAGDVLVDLDIYKHENNVKPRPHLELEALCNDLEKLMEKVKSRLDFTVEEHSERQTLLEQLEALCKWVLDWPVLKRQETYEKVSAHKSRGDPKLTQELKEARVRKHKDLLRRAHVPHTAKLQYTLLALKEELGLSTLNAAAHVFSGCHLLNALKLFEKTGLRRGQSPVDDESMLVQLTELISHRHVKEIFGGELPVQGKPLHRIMRTCAGMSTQNLKAPKRSKRTKELKPNENLRVLQEYLHEKISFFQMLHKFDRVMQQSETKKRSRKSLLETEFLEFLREMEPIIKDIFDWAGLDYLGCHCDWLKAFQEMNAKIQERKLSIKPFDVILEPTESEWKTQTSNPGKWYSYCITGAILREIEGALHKRDKMMGKSSKLETSTPLVDIALQVLGRS